MIAIVVTFIVCSTVLAMVAACIWKEMQWNSSYATTKAAELEVEKLKEQRKLAEATKTRYESMDYVIRETLHELRARVAKLEQGE